MRNQKKIMRNLNDKQKQFIMLLNRYAISLCLLNKEREIKEFTDLIRIQNERSDYK